MMKTALEGMIENERKTTENETEKRRSTKNDPGRKQWSKSSDKESSGKKNLVPSTTLASTSPSSSSNCVFVTEKKPRRKTASENFSVANSSTKSGTGNHNLASTHHRYFFAFQQLLIPFPSRFFHFKTASDN